MLSVKLNSKNRKLVCSIAITVPSSIVAVILKFLELFFFTISEWYLVALNGLLIFLKSLVCFMINFTYFPCTGLPLCIDYSPNALLLLGDQDKHLTLELVLVIQNFFINSKQIPEFFGELGPGEITRNFGFNLNIFSTEISSFLKTLLTDLFLQNSELDYK